jgi:hypothetical protein
MLMAFKNSTNIKEARFQAQICFDTVPLWNGPIVRFNDSYSRIIRDFCVVQLPPWLQGISDPSALTLRIKGTRVEAVETTVNLDYFYLLPLESYRMFNMTINLPYTGALVDNGPEGRVYSEAADETGRMGNAVAYGQPIMVQPGALQRLYFLSHMGLSNTAPIDRTLSIQAWYRPRRLTL